MMADNWPEILAAEANNGLPLSLNHDKIIELWYSGEGTPEQRKELEDEIAQSVITGRLEAVVLLRDPESEGGYRKLPVERWRSIKDDGTYGRSFVSYEIHRDDFKAWLEAEAKTPLPDDSLLYEWWAGPTLQAILREKPDYERWERAEGFLTLSDAVCFAVGVCPNPGSRVRWAQSDSEKYDELLKRATGAILQGVLEGNDVNGTQYVGKVPFFQWVVKQGEELAEDFLSRQPVDRTQPSQETKVSPGCLPGDLRVIVDDVNEKVTVSQQVGNKKANKFSRSDIVGKGVVTWELLVAFARCNGSLEGNTAADVKKLNTSGNRKNLSEKLVAAMNLIRSPIVEGRRGLMRFQSIQLAGGTSSPDAMDRKTFSTDDQATEYLKSRGDNMPVID